jgi:hypothetical protein
VKGATEGYDSRADTWFVPSTCGHDCLGNGRSHVLDPNNLTFRFTELSAPLRPGKQQQELMGSIPRRAWVTSVSQANARLQSLALMPIDAGAKVLLRASKDYDPKHRDDIAYRTAVRCPSRPRLLFTDGEGVSQDMSLRDRGSFELLRKMKYSDKSESSLARALHLDLPRCLLVGNLTGQMANVWIVISVLSGDFKYHNGE